jgi:methionyl-tRNA formyltransferase
MDKKNTKFAFFGTPEVASKTLEILKQGGYTPALIITSPDRPSGRKMIITPPPVKVWAIENNIPYIQPENPNNEEIYNALGSSSQAGEPRKAIREHADMRGDQSIVDFFIVVAYGKIMPDNLINFPRLGSFNIHYSLLPKYRGASPVESAILNGDTETGVTIQKMRYKMDTGPIVAVEKTEIGNDERAPELRKRLIRIGGNLLVKVLPDISEGKINLTEQDDSQATYCGKMTKEDGLLDLNDDPEKNYNRFRAYKEWPRTYFFKESKRYIITDAELREGKFVVKKVIPENGKERNY